MSEKRVKKIVNMGSNLAIARKWRKMSQSELANKIGLHQTEVSTLEKKEVIDLVILETISKAMNIQLDFFTEFDFDNAMQPYITNNEEVTITTGEYASVGEVMQQKIIENQTIEKQEIISSIPIEKYNEIVDQRIKDAEEIGRLKQQIEYYQNKESK